LGDGRFNGTMQNVVGPTLVAMATKFGLGAEIQSPTSLSVCVSVNRVVTRLENLEVGEFYIDHGKVRLIRKRSGKLWFACSVLPQWR